MHFLFSFDDAASSVHSNQYNHCLVNVWVLLFFHASTKDGQHQLGPSSDRGDSEQKQKTETIF